MSKKKPEIVMEKHGWRICRPAPDAQFRIESQRKPGAPWVYEQHFPFVFGEMLLEARGWSLVCPMRRPRKDRKAKAVRP